MTTGFGTGTSDVAMAVRVQADGRIVVAGYTNATGSNDLAVLRYTYGGALDGDFDSDGLLSADLGGADLGHALWLGPDYKVTVAGYTNASGNNDFAVARDKVSAGLEERSVPDELALAEAAAIGCNRWNR